MSTILISNIDTLVTMNPTREILNDAYLVAENGAIVSCGTGTPPENDYSETHDASGCVVTPGFINTHHHLFQTNTRAKFVDSELFEWLVGLYPIWAELKDNQFLRGAVVGMNELLRSGCTTTTDHHYLFPQDASPELIDITIEAAKQTGIRFHATRGSMSRSKKDGGLPPDSVVQDHDTILKDSQRLLEKYHDTTPGAMTRIALAPCSPFSVTTELMRDTAELARQHGALLHTHLGETVDENNYCSEIYSCRPVDLLEQTGWLANDVWLAHGIHFTDDEVAKLGKAGVAVSHCPTSNMRLGSGICRVRDLRAAGSPVSLGVDGSASNDSSHMLSELRQTLLLHRVLGGAKAMSVMEVLEMATLDGAKTLNRDDIGSIEPGKQCDLAVWNLTAPEFEKVHDPVAALLLCRSVDAREVFVGGRNICNNYIFA
jgi:8-oxoguanine deaminase